MDLAKIIVVTILLSGLISIPLHFTAANATMQNATTTNHVITGDTQRYRIYEGFAPTMQPWENGMVTNPMPGTFERWYLQGAFKDGSNTQLSWIVKPWLDNNGPLQPYLTIYITTPNGTVQFGEVRVPVDQFNAARNTLNVTMGENWLRGDLNTIKLHIPTTRSEGELGADLVFKSAAPPTRFGGSGMWFFDPSLTRFSATNDAMPYAIVSGNLTAARFTRYRERGIWTNSGEQSTGIRPTKAGTGQLVIMVTTQLIFSNSTLHHYLIISKPKMSIWPKELVQVRSW